MITAMQPEISAERRNVAFRDDLQSWLAEWEVELPDVLRMVFNLN